MTPSLPFGNQSVKNLWFGKLDKLYKYEVIWKINFYCELQCGDEIKIKWSVC